MTDDEGTGAGFTDGGEERDETGMDIGRLCSTGRMAFGTLVGESLGVDVVKSGDLGSDFDPAFELELGTFFDSPSGTGVDLGVGYDSEALGLGLAELLIVGGPNLLARGPVDEEGVI